MVETGINILINDFFNLLTLNITTIIVSGLSKFLCFPSGVEKHVELSQTSKIKLSMKIVDWVLNRPLNAQIKLLNLNFLMKPLQF